MAAKTTILTGLLKKVRDIHRDHAEGHYETAQILYGLYESHSYQTLGFDTWGEFKAKVELPLSVHQIQSYVDALKNQKRLKYTKPEFIDLLRHLSIHQLNRTLNKLDKKASPRVVIKRDKQYYQDYPQMAFTFEPEVLRAVEAKLSEQGMEFSDEGRRLGCTDALLVALGIDKANPSKRQRKRA